MADSQFRVVGRGLGALVAASLLAGVSTQAAAGNAGNLYFETGKLLTNFRFVYEDASGIERATQTFKFIKGCNVTLDTAKEVGTNDSLAPLVALTATGGRNSLGYIATSLGVFDGPQGTDCGRVSKDKNEALQVALSSGLVDFGAFLFDRLLLDLEVKGDVALQLDVKIGDAVQGTYYLTAGAGQAPAGAANVFRCRETSDSGPDSGPNDNCRWDVSATGRSFKITPLSGEFSFEGGGDYSEVLLNRTVISLAQPDGEFDCGESDTVADAAMSCTVNRLDPGGEACTPVPYIFRTGGGSCELTVDPQDQQFVANLFVSYQPEPSTSGTLASTTWPAAPLSKVEFATKPGTSFSIPACRGVTIDDGFVGPSPIPETKPDWVPETTGTIEFACAFQRTETFETGTSGLETWISEGIQFWGDIKFERF